MTGGPFWSHLDDGAKLCHLTRAIDIGSFGLMLLELAIGYKEYRVFEDEKKTLADIQDAVFAGNFSDGNF
jgi:hypothetical protein